MTKLSFAESFSETQCLLNLPFELKNAVIKKGMNESAILCTDKETYTLLDEKNSNTLLLTTNAEIIGKAAKVIKAVKTTPNIGHVIKLMKPFVYKSTTDIKYISLPDLLNQCACSDAECLDILPGCYCVEYKDGYCKFDFNYLFESLLLFDTSPQLMEDRFIKSYISSYFYSNKLPVWSRIVKFITLAYFEKSRAGDSRQYSLFLSDLSEFFSNIVVELKYFSGICVVEDLITYIPEHYLPSAPQDRFKLMFQYKASYSYDQMVPFIKPISKNDRDLNHLLKSYCRLVNSVLYLR